tara:strand:- start:285 stop:506 length:222 start_codon:yes stop_codon:yes gene_type:complete
MFSTSNKNVHLGRWAITYDNKELEKKVYYANHDHCGPCGYLYDEKRNKRPKHLLLTLDEVIKEKDKNSLHRFN